jgi:5'-3' exonuclease
MLSLINHLFSKARIQTMATHTFEQQIFTSIFAYVDRLFGKIKPKKAIFISVDGVAPRER